MASRIVLTILLAVIISCKGVSQDSPKLVVVEKKDVLSNLPAREPMLAVHPNGDFYVAGFANASKSPQLWKSSDDGTSWEKINVGTVEEGADGNSDVDLIIDKTGAIYFLTMKYTEIPADTTGFDWGSLKGEHIAVGVSKNSGSSWNWSYISRNEFDDRPWIEEASDGSIHIIWNDGNGIHYTSSRDQGNSWDERRSIYAKGGSSHFAAGNDGLLAVRVVPNSASGNRFDAGVDLIRFSNDSGTTWNDMQVPGSRTWNRNVFAGIPRWVEPIAWDSENNLFYLWSEGNFLKLGVTKNLGEDWQTYIVFESEHTIYFPYLSIDQDKITGTWVSGFGENLTHNAAFIMIEDEGISISYLDPQKLVDIQTRFGADQNLSIGGEYFPIQALSDGSFGMVTTIQNYAANRFGFTWWKLALE